MTATALMAQVEALRRSEPGAALAALEHGFAAAHRRADAATRGALWRTRAHVLRSLRRTREAAVAYQRAARAFAAAGDAREEGRCAIGRVDALMYLGRTREARRTAARGRRLLSAAGDRAALARLLNNEGNLWHRLDLPGRALVCYRRAVRELERAGDPRSAAMVGTNIGNCLSLLGRLDDARRHYREAHAAQQAAQAANEALSAEYNLAYLDYLAHEDEAALAGLARVRATAEARGYPSLAALARLDRAEILLRLGAHEEASAEADAAVSACAALTLDYEQAKAELFAALARFRLSQPAAARRGIERALARFDAQGNAVWTGEALLALATLWHRESNVPAAAALLSAARRRFTSAGDRERAAGAATLEARARLALGERASARRLLATVSRLRRRSARLEHLRLAAAAALARAEGRTGEARRLLRTAAAHAERLAARILDEEWRSTFWGEWGWPHRELAVLELEHGDAAAALEALEAGRGRALLGPAAVRRAHASVLPASVQRWTVRRQARERTPGTRRAGGVAAVDAGLNRVLRQRDSGDVRAASICRALPADVQCLDQWSHAGMVGTLSVTRGGVTGRRALAAEDHLARLVHAALFALRGAAFQPREARHPDPALADLLTEIAALALWPVLEPKARALALAPVGALARLPWAALPLPDGRALVEDRPLVVVPGLRLALARRERRASGAPLVVAVDTGDLAAVADEIAAVAALFPSAIVLSGGEATAERFRALAPTAPWIHFAGHGAFRADAPQESGLRLADRWLLAGELADVPLAADWVTLSACHTARALVRPGEEWFGLARAFLLAGARTVVAAQWDIEDAATAALMAGLYPRVAAGAGMAHALAAEQAERARAGGHPLDWAGFVALGAPAALADSHPRMAAAHGIPP